MNNKLLEIEEKVKNGDFDDNELIDLVLHLERENQILLEENKKLNSKINKANKKLYLFGETLNPYFQQEMLNILGDEDE